MSIAMTAPHKPLQTDRPFRIAPVYCGKSLWVRIDQHLYTNGEFIVSDRAMRSVRDATPEQFAAACQDWAAATERSTHRPTSGIVRRVPYYGMVLCLDASGQPLVCYSTNLSTWTLFLRGPGGRVEVMMTSNRNDVIMSADGAIAMVGEQRFVKKGDLYVLDSADHTHTNVVVFDGPGVTSFYGNNALPNAQAHLRKWGRL